MLAIEINNPEIETRFEHFAKTSKKSMEDLASEALKIFLDMHKSDEQFSFTKKDPMKHLHEIHYPYDEALCDDAALTHIEDSAQYVHDMRRKRRYE